MSSRHQDVEYIPLDSAPPSEEQNSARRPVLSAKYAGRLFLTAVFFAGILLGAILGRSFTALPTIITPPIPSYEPLVTILDSFVDMCASAHSVHSSPSHFFIFLCQQPCFPRSIPHRGHDQVRRTSGRHLSLYRRLLSRRSHPRTRSHKSKHRCQKNSDLPSRAYIQNNQMLPSRARLGALPRRPDRTP